ncbi:1120_t:CDS:2 [Cetraspora pellucida]|uniref:1120_t:CDS:1 n=1 Tax=Cetraspora pellucida TaxID=1433469 RepID=A0ACA9L3A5_9GLOM|nr:1120_t:CDS:2 [Cetraspora pellucida]
MVREPSIALKTIIPFSDNRQKKRSSDCDDEIPLIIQDWTEESSSSSSRHRRRNLPSSSSDVLLSNMRAPNAKARTISFHVSNKIKKKYPPNVIRNQKYNLITFFPLVFYEQEAYDDWKRYKRDQENNSQKYQILTRDGPKNVPSSKLRVGDLVIIHKDQRVPADLILLRTTETSGACFIRTDQLDGETDWKLRLAVPYCQKLHTDSSLLSIDAEIYADTPSKDIHNFIGNFSIQLPSNVTTQIEPLNVENTLWMNTVLASGTAIGFVIYTGKDTRAVMNTSHPETKSGLLDQEINNLSKVI